MRRTKLIPAFGLLLLLSACKVGPNYARPNVPSAPTYRGPDNTAVSTPQSLGDEKWWAIFKDPELQGLIRKALQNNYNVQIAASRVLQAQANVTITRADQFPTIGAGPTVSGVRSPGIPGYLLPYSYLADALTGSASWNLDFWGRYRRATEAARAELASTEWGRRAVLASVVEQVAAAYFQLRGDDLQLELAKKTLASRQESLKLAQALEQGGRTSLIDVRQAEQLVEEAAAIIPQLEQSIQQQENQISILLATNPGQIKRGAAITAQPIPDTVPPGIPSQLLERRPDIQSAEQNLVAANARIGVARAQLFPNISLTGDFGVQSIGLHNFFNWGARTWNWTAEATQPIFNAGALRANVRLSQAQQEEALASYRQTIQGAFGEVSNSLIAYQKVRDAREHQQKLAEVAASAAQLSGIRYQGGATSYLEVLTSETNSFSAQLSLAQAELNERLALVQLYNALGGGWAQ